MHLPFLKLPQKPQVVTTQVILKGLRAAIIAAAPGAYEQPLATKALARRTFDYEYNSHFRATIKQLVDDGLLVRIGGGIRKKS